MLSAICGGGGSARELAFNGRRRAATADWSNSVVPDSWSYDRGESGALGSHGDSPLISFAMHPYLSNVWPVSRAAFAMPQAETITQVNKAIVILMTGIDSHLDGSRTSRSVLLCEFRRKSFCAVRTVYPTLARRVQQLILSA